jgi:LuxR family maltose regulon positive regulatory protein
MATAVLDQMTGSLCDALTGSDDGSAMLEELERSNLFVVPLDDQRTWYRYHHLFAEALLDSLASTPAAPSPCTALPASGTPTTACSRTPCITRSPVGRSVERRTSSRRRFPNFDDADATASFVPGSAPCPRAKFGPGRC